MVSAFFSTPALFLLFLCPLIGALTFPSYSHEDHPLNTQAQFEDRPPPVPVVMKKYYRYRSGVYMTSGLLFVPGGATYNDRVTGDTYAENLDVLYTDGIGGPPPPDKVSEKFIEVHLNHPARVILLLTTLHVHKRLINLTISGLGPEWKGERALLSPTGNIPLGDPERLRRKLLLPKELASIETTVTNGKLELRHPSTILISGYPATRYYLLFAKEGAGSPIAFDYPTIPDRVKNLMTGHSADTIPVSPNVKCPEWVHNLYVVRSRDPEVAKRHLELPYWRTWHASIDPIYWCYFDHEHGSYPGKYEPAFDYTAWKTFDSATFHGRQDESHAGFKVFSFPLSDQNKFVVIVVHMHLSVARRFSARHHTVSFAVLDKDWTVEMELHMKMDFGAAEAALRNGSNIPIDDHEAGIRNDLLRKKRFAGRRFNILNITEEYPDSVDQRFLLSSHVAPTLQNKGLVLRGIYEQWRGPLNTCSGTVATYNRGFNFDVRNPATGMRSLKGGTDATKQIMSGDSTNRFLDLSRSAASIEVGIEHCEFDVFRSDAGVSLERTGGVFYTDAYFSAILNTAGKNSVRQYIKPEFTTIYMKPGKITAVDPWNSHMEYQVESLNRSRVFRNTENAVRADVN